MRIERRFVEWGVFLIALGALPLAVQLGRLDRSALADSGRLWPVLLIAIGLGVLLGRGRFGLPFRVLPPIALGLLIGAALAGGLGAIGCFAGDQRPAALPAGGGTLSPRATVGMTVDCGTATLTTAAGSGWAFSGTGDPNRPPSILAEPDSVSIVNGRVDFLDFGAARSDWQLSLPTDPTLDLSLEMNASDARLDLAGARLGGLSLTTNAGSVKVNLSGVVQIDSLDATASLRVELNVACIGGHLQVDQEPVRGWCRSGPRFAILDQPLAGEVVGRQRAARFDPQADPGRQAQAKVARIDRHRAAQRTRGQGHHEIARIDRQ